MKKILVVVAMVFIFLGCGGGGSDSSGDTSTSYAGFVTGDFSGKAMYYATSSRYQIIVFNENGSVQGSSLVSSGVPVVSSDIVAQWSIVSGEMVVTSSETTVRYRLVSQNVSESSFTVDKYSSNGIVSRNMLFYNPATALAQAQTHIASANASNQSLKDTECNDFHK